MSSTAPQAPGGGVAAAMSEKSYTRTRCRPIVTARVPRHHAPVGNVTAPAPGRRARTESNGSRFAGHFSFPQAPTDRRRFTAIGITGKETHEAPACRGLVRSAFCVRVGEPVTCVCSLVLARGQQRVGTVAPPAMRSSVPHLRSTRVRPGWRRRCARFPGNPSGPVRTWQADAAGRLALSRWRLPASDGEPATTRGSPPGHPAGASANHNVRRDMHLKAAQSPQPRCPAFTIPPSRFPIPSLKAPNPAASRPPGHWAGRGCARAR
ncbi:hypothetical protein QE400_002931 [Xanthomonas sacchari]|nr:hypothetical protein [Xanthomonas sacchari]